jgi:adenosylhomocysteine nucleosidase
MLRIGVVAALAGELAPLVQGWEQTGRVYKGQISCPSGGIATVYAGRAGMGSAAATRAFAEVTAAATRDGGEKPLDALVSYGWVGALSCGVKPPDAFQVSEVIDSLTGERFATVTAAPPALLRLVTLDHVARSQEKRPLAKQYQAVLVDMEAATVARLALAHGIPFLCLKAISDGYRDVLPDFNRFLDRERQLRTSALVAHSLVRPRYWRSLARLGTNSAAAARNLAAELPLCLHAAGLVSCTS